MIRLRFILLFCLALAPATALCLWLVGAQTEAVVPGWALPAVALVGCALGGWTLRVHPERARARRMQALAELADAVVPESVLAPEQRRLLDEARAGNDEIARLAARLEAMIDRVEDYARAQAQSRGVINGLNAGLENRVAARTRDLELAHEEALIARIDPMLAFARLQPGPLRLQPEPVDLNALCGSVIALFAGLARRRQIAIRLLADPALHTPVIADPVRIRQVLTNLLDVALRSLPGREWRMTSTRETAESPEAGGSQAVVGPRTTGLRPGRCRLTLTSQPDSGREIQAEPDEARRAVGEGGRGPEAGTDGGARPPGKVSGRTIEEGATAITGLQRQGDATGAAILRLCDELVVAMGGRLAFIETDDGRLLGFQIHLPADATTGETESDARVAHRRPPDREGLPSRDALDVLPALHGHALVIGPDGSSDRGIRLMLESLGLEVIEIDGTEAALASWRRTPTALVFIDCRVSAGSGLQTWRAWQVASAVSPVPRERIVLMLDPKDAIASLPGEPAPQQLLLPIALPEMHRLLSRWLGDAVTPFPGAME